MEILAPIIKQNFDQELQEEHTKKNYLHPLEVLLSIIVGIEVLVCLDPENCVHSNAQHVIS